MKTMATAWRCEEAVDARLRGALALLLVCLLCRGVGLAGEEPATKSEEPGATATPAPTESAPSLVIERTEIDAGEVLRGESVHFTFALKNAGKSPLSVDAKPTCNCTVARFDSSVAPGADGKVEADMNTSGMQGKVRRTINVTTNDPSKPSLGLTIVASVVPVVQIERAPGKVLVLKPGEPMVEEFVVRILSADPGEVTGVTCSVPHAKAALEPLGTPDDKGRAYRVRLTVEPAAPLGLSRFTAVIATTSKREPAAVVQIACEKGIGGMPATVEFGQIAAQTRFLPSRRVIVRRQEGAFRILKMESSDPRVEVREEKIEASSQHQLMVSYRGGAAPGTRRGTIRVETDDPSQPVLEIATHYVVAPAAPAPSDAPPSKSPAPGDSSDGPP